MKFVSIFIFMDLMKMIVQIMYSDKVFALLRCGFCYIIPIGFWSI